MSERARITTENIREDGTVVGHVVETHFLPLESVSVHPGEGGYISVVGDGGPVNYEMRLPLDRLLSFARTLEAAPSVEGEREARWEMQCQECGAKVYLPATANGHAITGITGWSFDTENGWRCYGCAPTPAGSDPEEE